MILRTVELNKLPISFVNLEKQKIIQDLQIVCDPVSAERACRFVNYLFERVAATNSAYFITNTPRVNMLCKQNLEIAKGEKIIVLKP